MIPNKKKINELDEFLTEGVSGYQEFQTNSNKKTKIETKTESDEQDEEILNFKQHHRSSDITKIYFTYDYKNGTGLIRFFSI